MKLPWVKFWVDDYLGSERVGLMSIPQEWAYFNLLLRCMKEGSVPADPKECVRLLGKRVRESDAAFALKGFSPVDGQPGRVAHPRATREREAAIRFCDFQKEKAAKRWGSATASKNGCHGNATAMPNESHGNARAGASEPESESEEDKEGDNTNPSKSIHPVSATHPGQIDSRGGVSLSRPDSEEAAIKLCRAQMVNATDDFIRRMFAHLESVGWVNGTGTAEIANFTAYVRKAWLQSRDEASRREAGRPAPVEIDEALCEEVRDLWNEIAGNMGMTRSRVAPGISTKRAICAAFAGFKGGDQGQDHEAAKRYKMGTFRILFSALGKDPAWNGSKGRRAGFEFAVSAAGLNHAAEGVGS